MDDNQQMAVSDVAKVLGLTPQWIRKLADDGTLPSTRTVSGIRLFKLRDVQALKRRRDAAKREVTP